MTAQHRANDLQSRHRSRHGRRLAIVLAAAGVIAVAIVVSLALTHHRSAPTAQRSPVAAVLTNAPAGPASAIASGSPTPLVVGPATDAITNPPTTPTSSSGIDGVSASVTRTSTSATSATPRYIRYTVKPGDNLWVIANWFHQQGFQPIYQWNRTTIGEDPALIRPGQVLIVAVEQ